VAADFPWYNLVQSGGELEQGDLLFGCPVVSPAPEMVFPIPQGTIPAVSDILDVVVMSQSCDLVNDKIADVLLCAHWDLDKAAGADPELRKSQEAIRKGQHYRYLLLARSEIQERMIDVRIVDFGRILSLPKQFVNQVAASQAPRLRLLSPYREHLSQSFARFFMRVGLPRDVSFKSD
jgi:hypothetical protein